MRVLLLPFLCGVSLVAACSSLPDVDDDFTPENDPSGRQEGGTSSGGEPGDPVDGGDGSAPIPNGPPVHQSGTRLKARWAVTQDGYRAFDGWYDATRKEACTLQTAADGLRRCLPRETIDRTALFSDASCAVALAEVFPAQCAPASSVSRYDSATGRTRLYQRGAKHTGTFYEVYGGKCQPIIASGASYYAIGSEVPAASFVEMVGVTAPSPARITERFLQGSDGSHELVGWTDQPFKSYCTFGKARDASDRCLPFSALGGDYFSDTACQTPVVTFDVARTDSPLFAFVPSGSCTQGAAYFRVGASVPGDKLSRLSGATCAPAGVTRQAWAMTEIPPADMAAPFAVQDPSGRIRGSSFATPEEGKRQFLGWTDTALGNVKCKFKTTADGKVRCAPESLVGTGTSGNYFNDAACSKPFAYATTTKGNCAPPRYATGAPAACTDAPRYYALSATLYTGEIFSKFGAGACTKQAPSTRDVYEVGAEVNVTDFAEGSFSTDP